MNPNAHTQWLEANHQYLVAAIRAVQVELEAYIGPSEMEATAAEAPGFWQRLLRKLPFWKKNRAIHSPQATTDAKEVSNQAAQDPAFRPALDTLTATFRLSQFETKILLLCAGMELDARFSALLARLNGGNAGGSARPTFSLALAAFADAHWSAISPNSPLRYWNLILLTPSDLLTRSSLKIDEYILHYLTGIRYMDEKLTEILDPVSVDYPLAPSQARLAEVLANACTTLSGNGSGAGRLPFVQLKGDERSDQLAVAALAATAMGCQLYKISVLSLPTNAKEASDLLRWWNRESALSASVLYLDCTKLDAQDKPRLQSVLHLIENVQGILLAGGCGNEISAGAKRWKLEFEVKKPSAAEQMALWKSALGAGQEQQQLEKMVAQFNLSAKAIAAIVLEVKPRLGLADDAAETGREKGGEALFEAIWKSCCVHTRPELGDLAQRIKPVATWKDIVLPDEQINLLKEIAARVKHRNTVYRDWGFEGMSSRGLGISALFAGESGTGKTMASEVLANELHLDLYRIDLSQVVNKYIGETEKNLKRIFDAAEEGGSILLFDEADALFGKRSEVKDSHDRYSNIEVSYLLQRMESYKGLAILTTNMKKSLDPAFLRRISCLVQFPYPDAGYRKEIWSRAFPKDTPRRDIDCEKLSRLSIPGGNIRNVALNAAFMAAAEGVPVQMPHLFQAARGEYRKLEKTFSNSEIEALR